MEDYWPTIASLHSQLPSTDGKENYFFTTDEMNELAMQNARVLLMNATSIEDFDKAMLILTTDRGIGAKGQQLGSLKSTNREDVAKLFNDIGARRFQFESHALQRESWEEQNQIKDLFITAFTKTDLDNPENVRDIVNQLQLIDPTSVATFQRLIDIERDSKVSDEAKLSFLMGISNGEYGYDVGQLLKDFETGNFPLDFFPSAMAAWGDAHQRSKTNEEPIYWSNDTYSRGTTEILGAIEKSFFINGMLSPNYKDAARNANFYIQSTILQEEINWKLENPDTPMSQEYRRQFMNSLGDHVVKMFSNAQLADPQMQPFQEVKALDDDLAQNQTTFNEVVNQIVATPAMTFDMEDLMSQAQASLEGIQGDPVQQRIQMDAWMAENVYPQIASAVLDQLPSYLQDNVNIFLDRLMAGDNEIMRFNLSQALGIEPHYLQQALAQYRRANQ